MKAVLAKLSVLTLARLAGAVAMFATTVLVTRVFGVEAIAIFATAMAAASLAAVIVLAGFHAFAPVLAAEYEARGRYGLLRGLARTGYGNLAFATIVIGLAGGGFWLSWPDLLDGTWRYILPFVVCSAPAIAMLMLTGGLLTGLQRQTAAQLPDSLFRPVLLLSAVCGLVLILPEAGIGWVLALSAAGFWIAAAVQALPLLRALRQRRNGPVETDRARWWRMSPSWLTIALAFDYAIEVHLLVAAAIAGAPEVAILHICFRYRVLAGFGMRSIYAVCQPKIYAADASGDRDAVQSALALTNALAMAYAIACFAGLWLTGPALMGLFGPEFTDSAAILLIVSATFLVRALFGPAMALLAVRGHHVVIARTLAFSLGFAVLGSLVLYAPFGIAGIALAYTGGNVVSAATLWWIARARTGIDCAAWKGELSLPRIWRSA